MNITIELVKKDEKEILRNLLEKYNYEFSLYDDRDVNDLGLYGYDYFDCYWTEENRYPFFVKVDGKLAGFVLLNDHSDLDTEINYAISEFFVMYKYRRYGIGKYVVKYLFDNYKGKWQLKYHTKNEISQHFWLKIVDEYTNGKYEKTERDLEVFGDRALWHILSFET